jgi:hypothetical protein
MVDISRALTSANHPSKFAPDVRLPYMVEVTVTAAQMIAAKGSAIAAADVYDILRVPAGTAVLHVWAKCTAAFAGSSTDLTLNVGYTGADVDVWVAAWDFDAAAVGSFGTRGVGLPPAGALGATDAVVTGGAGLISMVVATQTGTWTGGTITFYALCVDLSDYDNSRSGLPALGS